ncbi:uncharacterized protein LOC132204245 [Neocloeon triangulifer]|uniref:uncharacterized protein LOC132204245 n=1 Tax=Neocloeon triangulifer TaxID=2078957 RepID=UPI00286F5BB9|nr:uncharacterized protein LOC132204245 [Neocloeon triangulifer]
MELNDTSSLTPDAAAAASNSSGDWRVACLPSGCHPTWDLLHAHLRWLLLLHVYGFGFCFFVLSFYAFFSILNLRSLISSRPFMATINVFICLLGASRAASLFIDPYSLAHSLPKAIGSILWDVGFPCVTSAFCLIQLAFLQLTQLKFGPEKLRHKSCLSCIITSHFCVIIGADIAVAFSEQFLVAKYFMQAVYVIWSIYLCSTFLYVGHRVQKLVRSVPSGLLACGPLDANYKGIMQLAMLAPYNNLATSVAAALVPTLLAPRIRISDEQEHSSPSGGQSGQTSTSLSSAPTGTSEAVSNSRPGCSWMGGETGNASSWHKEAPGDEKSQQNESLLGQGSNMGPKPDYTLHTVLRHIALVSHSAAASDAGKNRKLQVEQVLKVTSATAVMGLMLCVAEFLRVLANLWKLLFEMPTTVTSVASLLAPLEPTSIWSWFFFHSTCRALELVMACAMAGVTKQPVVRPPQPFSPVANFRNARPSLYM